jgi:fructoselysine-6-P-deglycase FrlB-like protein
VNQPGFERDVLSEPDVLADMLDAYEARSSPLRGIDLGGARRVVMLGMGSSGFAAQVACVALRARGIDAHAELASTASPFPASPDTVAIGISASGTSEETLEAFRRHVGVSRTIAVTNYPDRALAEGADHVLPLLAGVEAGGVSCKSYQTTLAVLALLGGSPVADLRPAVAAARGLIDSRGAWLDELVARIASCHTLYTIAPVERLSSALESALMFREGPRIAADATETGDWLHVDVYLSRHPGYTALLFPGSRYDDGVMEWARSRGSSIVAVGRPVEGAVQVVPVVSWTPAVALLTETMVAELAAAALWATADANADRGQASSDGR